jgi:glycosyltransferase involved in cell wall biosynthesis
MSDSVAVVIPAFNRASFIGDALTSLQRQTYQDWQAIVVNDGSVDQTAAIVQEFSRKDKRITLLEHDRRKGAQAARNSGIRAAGTRWIAFLDSDDEYLPRSLEQRLQRAAETGFQVIHSACSVLDKSDSAKAFHVPPIEGNVYSDLLRGPGPTFPALMATREALSRIGYLDESILSYQEWDTAIRLARHYKFAFVPESTFLYRLGESDTISRDSYMAAIGYGRIFRKHFRSILLQVGPHAIANHYSNLAHHYRLAGRETKALYCMITAVAWWPLKLARIPHKIRQARGSEDR